MPGLQRHGLQDQQIERALYQVRRLAHRVAILPMPKSSTIIPKLSTTRNATATATCDVRQCDSATCGAACHVRTCYVPVRRARLRASGWRRVSPAHRTGTLHVARSHRTSHCRTVARVGDTYENRSQLVDREGL